jgi:NitT/TauT family transport system permease protein/taurine transport system permease protein
MTYEAFALRVKPVTRMADVGAEQGYGQGPAHVTRGAKVAALFMISVRSLTGALTLLGLLLLWWLLTNVTGIADPQRVPSPTDVVEAASQILFEGYAGGTLLMQAFYSVRLVFLGFLVAVMTGVPLGLIMGLNRRFEALVNPAFLLVRPIPPLAWIPLAIVWFGLGDSAKILVIWFAAFVPAVINSIAGVRNVNPVLIEAARVHGGSRREILTEVLLPGAMPMIFTGMRLSLQAAWTTLVAAELVGAFFGLGRVLMSAYRDINPAMIATAMIAVGLLGAAMMKLLALIERSVIRWRTV